LDNVKTRLIPTQQCFLGTLCFCLINQELLYYGRSLPVNEDPLDSRSPLQRLRTPASPSLSTSSSQSDAPSDHLSAEMPNFQNFIEDKTLLIDRAVSAFKLAETFTWYFNS